MFGLSMRWQSVAPEHQRDTAERRSAANREHLNEKGPIEWNWAKSLQHAGKKKG
jgi:hypothetical protein